MGRHALLSHDEVVSDEIVCLKSGVHADAVSIDEETSRLVGIAQFI